MLPDSPVLSDLSTLPFGSINAEIPLLADESTLFSNYGNKIFFLIILLYIFLTLIFKKLKI